MTAIDQKAKIKRTITWPQRTTNRRTHRLGKSLAAIGILIFSAGVSSNAAAEDELIGGEEFRLQCAACHGIDGKGDGSISQFLNIQPKDLTQISANNDGVFPFLEVFQIVDGRQEIRAHGNRAMPVWGNRYSAEAGDTYGPYGAEEIIRGRILEVVYYLQQIQEPK